MNRKPNPYLHEANHYDVGRLSEQRLAKDLKTELTPNSGASGVKGDLISDSLNLRIECKSTQKKSINLQLGWLVKIQREALAVGSDAALTISFVKSDGQPRFSGDWVLVSKDFFNKHINRN